MWSSTVSRLTKSASATRSAASMTVCANDLALRDLVEDALPVPGVELGADREPLVPKVVELEHDRVRVAAVDARMGHEVLDEIRGPLQRETLPQDPGLIDVALPVRRVVLPSRRRIGTVGRTSRADRAPSAAMRTLRRP